MSVIDNEVINGIAARTLGAIEKEAEAINIPCCQLQSSVIQKFVASHLIHMKKHHEKEHFEHEIKSILRSIEYARNV